jgi:hypothetical protein
MGRTPIEFYVSLDLNPLDARDALMHVVTSVGELRFPGRINVSVPIQAKVENRPARWESALHIAAAQNEAFFPTFDGAISVTPDGGNHCELWLQGSYEPPGGVIGKGIDVTVMHGVAEKTLRDFLSSIAEEVEREVKRFPAADR